MRVTPRLFAALPLIACVAIPAFGQTQALQTPATAAVVQTPVKADSKFALIDPEAFGDEKLGIKRLVAAQQSLDSEFKLRRDEITRLKTQYDALVKGINDTQKIADQKTITTKADQAEQLKSDIERKQQEGQKALEARVKVVLDPIYQDISNALMAFAAARGISVILNLSKLGDALMVVDYKDAMNITDAFIADYNQHHPVATAPAASP